MVISHSKKFIFIHNYKVAGTSITNALSTIGNESFRQSSLKDKLLIALSIYPKIFSSDFNVHITADELRKNIPGKIFDSYFKFGFVRNPWDWQVSLYLYMLKQETHHQHQLIKKMKGFDEYIDWRVNKDFHLQKDFFYDQNNVCLVDYIGKFEDIEASTKKLFTKFNLNIEIPHLNASRSNADYMHFYSEKSFNLIAEAFKEDITIFGYSDQNYSSFLK
jgi:hypothetical protein